ncbi:MAG: rod shape-determining protein MreC [Candidatus Levybacteria bacterium]|nr:rod shape-determining protein MreC [Candidatus Levybacteria bacterium]
MQEKNISKGSFFFFSLVSVFLIFLSGSFLVKESKAEIERLTSSVRSFEFSLISKAFGESENSAYKKLVLENQLLRQKLVDQERLISENKALKDQFQISYPKPQRLLPAKIIGSPNFIPGISIPESFIIDRGEKDGIKEGNVLVYESNLVGVVSKVSSRIAKVDVITSMNTSFTVRTVSDDLSEKSAIGLIRGDGKKDLILENVLLSDSLFPSQIVVTKGDVSDKGGGYPPDLIVGKVISVDKKENELFQKAQIQSFVNFEKLTTIFVVVQ